MTNVRTVLDQTGPFVFARTQIEALARTRLDAPLPASIAAARRVYTSAYPPRQHVIAQLRGGDPSMLTRFETAFRSAVAQDPDDYGLRTCYGEPLARAAASADVRALCVRLLGDDTLPSVARIHFAEGLAFPVIDVRAELDALFASSTIGDTYAAVYFGKFGAYPTFIPVERMKQIAICTWETDPETAHAAVDALAKASSHEANAALRDLQRRVDRTPLRSRLDGLLDTGPLESALSPVTDAEDEVWAVGFAQYTFDTETDCYPNGYDGVLAKLAGLVSPLLDDVIFEEVPPIEAREEGESDPEQLPDLYRLRAYTPDAKVEILAGDASDWLDVPAMLGLLNTLCRDRGATLRFVTHEGEGQNAYVLAGPEAAILDAVARGDLRLEAPDEAARSGRDFENAVLHDKGTR